MDGIHLNHRHTPLPLGLSTAIFAYILMIGFLQSAPVSSAAAGEHEGGSGTRVQPSLAALATIRFPGRPVYLQALVGRADARTIAVGGALGGRSPDLALAQVWSDGELDVAFGSAGMVLADFGGWETAQAAALQSDGKLIVVGSITDGPPPVGLVPQVRRILLVRFLPNGAVDTSFGSNGRVFLGAGNDYEEALGVAIQPDDRIVVVGTSSAGLGGSGFLVRLTPQGMLDPTFGSGSGLVLSPVATSWNAVLLSPDGSLLVAGDDRNADYAIARFRADGSPEAAFGAGGVTRINIAESPPIGELARFPDVPCWTCRSNDRAQSLAVQQDGKLLVAGTSDRSMALARLDPDGSLDSGFGSGGVAPLVSTGTRARVVRAKVAVDAHGRVMVSSFTFHGHYPWLLTRYRPDGFPDQSFGTQGNHEVHFSDQASGGSLLVRSDAVLIIGGTVRSSGQESFTLRLLATN
jgi:uncharacterized delta-60 repeat protein